VQNQAVWTSPLLLAAKVQQLAIDFWSPPPTLWAILRITKPRPCSYPGCNRFRQRWHHPNPLPTLPQASAHSPNPGSRSAVMYPSGLALVSAAFSEVKQAAKRIGRRGNKHSSGVVLLIDEADALAQSRELGQMHHEDRAGVNALIRGVDDLASGNLPAIVVMCTNRLDALDPAVRRRAAVTFTFSRPNEAQRLAFLRPVLEELGFTSSQIHNLVVATGPIDGRAYGCTYSDLAQRYLPALVLDAFPDASIHYERALSIAKDTLPTPPFRET